MKKKVLIEADPEKAHMTISDEDTDLDVYEIVGIMLNAVILTCQDQLHSDPRETINALLDSYLEDLEEDDEVEEDED